MRKDVDDDTYPCVICGKPNDIGEICPECSKDNDYFKTDLEASGGWMVQDNVRG
jgi:hypothetical protein